MNAAQILTIVAASLGFLAIAGAVGVAIVAAFRELDDPLADDDDEEDYKETTGKTKEDRQ